MVPTAVVAVANRTSITGAVMWLMARQLMARQLVSLKATSATAEVVDVDHTAVVVRMAVVVCTAKEASGMVAVAAEIVVLTQVCTPTTPQPDMLQPDMLQPDMLRLDTLITHQYATRVTVVKASIAELRVGVLTAVVVVVAYSQVGEFMIACSAISMRLTRANQDTLPITLAAKQDFLISTVL